MAEFAIIAPLVLGIIFLVCSLALLFERRRRPSRVVDFTLAAMAILLTKSVVFFIVTAKALGPWSKALAGLDTWHVAGISEPLEGTFNIAIVACLMFACRRPALARRFLLINVPCFVIGAILCVLAGHFSERLPSHLLWLRLTFFRIFAMLAFEQLARCCDDLSEFNDPDNPELVEGGPTLKLACRITYLSNGLLVFAELSHWLVAAGYVAQAASHFIFLRYSMYLAGSSWREAMDELEAKIDAAGHAARQFEGIREEVIHSPTEATVLRRVVEAAVQTTGASGAALWLLRADGYFANRAVTGRFPPLRAHAPSPMFRADLLQQWVALETFLPGETWAGAVVAGKEPFLANELAYRPHSLVPQTVPWVCNLCSLSAVPLIDSQGQVLGVLAVVNRNDLDPRFSRQDLARLKVIAQLALLGLRQVVLLQEQIAKRVDDRDLFIASALQRNLMPAGLRRLPGLTFHGYSAAARFVGGDYFDLMVLSKGRYGVVISDVAGKGVPASLVMVMISTVFRGQVHGSAGTSELVAQVNATLCRDSSIERFATLLYLVIDLPSRTFCYTNAGHGALLVYRTAEGRCDRYGAETAPLGLDVRARFEDRWVPWAPGELCVLHTDGITEAKGLSGELFGIDRLSAQVVRHHALPPEEISRRILDEVRAFTGGAPAHDDETLLVLRL